MTFKIESAVRKVKAGDKSAFAEIIDESSVVVRAYISFYVSDSSLVDDILQETYIKVYREIEKYQAGTNFMGWIKEVARYEALGHRKSQQKNKVANSHYQSMLFTMVGEAASEADASSPLNRKLVALRRCLAKLPKKTHGLVDLRYFKGMTLEDVSIKSGVKSSTAGMAIHRARLALAQCINKLMQGQTGLGA